MKQNPQYPKNKFHDLQSILPHNMGEGSTQLKILQYTFKRLRRAASISSLTLYRRLTFFWVVFIAAQTRLEISGPSLGLIDLTHSSWLILNSCLKNKKSRSKKNELVHLKVMANSNPWTTITLSSFIFPSTREGDGNVSKKSSLQFTCWELMIVTYKSCLKYYQKGVHYW